jgi:hypothetical protein
MTAKSLTSQKTSNLTPIFSPAVKIQNIQIFYFYGKRGQQYS